MLQALIVSLSHSSNTRKRPRPRRTDRNPTQHRFRPLLEPLEGRLTPSTLGHGLMPVEGPTVHAAQMSHSSEAIAPMDQQTPSAVVDFKNFPANPANGYSVTVEVEASQIYQQKFLIAQGTAPQQVRDLVVASLQSGGWTVTTSGTTAFTVTGWTSPQKTFWTITKIVVSTGQLTADQQPIVSVSANVSKGPEKAAANPPISPPTPWGLSFDPTDETSAMEDNATVQVFLNGTEIDTAVSDGMTAEQVDQAVDTSLEQAGVDAVFSGGTIDFTSINGQAVTNVQADFAPASNSSGLPVDWLGTDISLPTSGSPGT